MIEIPELVTSAWTTLQPFLPILATRAAEEISKTTIAKIWSAIEKKFDTRAVAKEALEDLLKTPENEDAHVVFREQLKKILEEDNAFASDLSKLLESVRSDYNAQLIGNGAIAQGDGSVAVGQGGIYIGGNVSGSNIIMGNNNSIHDKKKK
jgi:hypothetical protein